MAAGLASQAQFIGASVAAAFLLCVIEAFAKAAAGFACLEACIRNTRIAICSACGA
jgi:hypothetical protein